VKQALLPVILLVALTVILLYPGSPGSRGSNAVNREYHRIVSLSPSLTKMIIDMGAEEKLAGVTSYHPPLSKKVPVAGSLVNLNLEKIMTLEPGIVLLSMEDNPTQFSERLYTMPLTIKEFSEYSTFSSICDTYREMSVITGTQIIAERKITKYRKQRNNMITADKTRISVLFLLSDRPFVAAAEHSFIGNIIKDAGGQNIITTRRHQYPVINAELIISEDPRVIITTSTTTVSRFKELLGERHTHLQALKNDTVKYIAYDPVTYYTPGDYVKSLAEMKQLFNKVTTTGQ